MFKIGEFSKLTQVSVRMLRYYDEAGLLKPAEIDEFTGYRYYSSLQIPLLNKIVYLRDSGFNVSEIASALDNWQDDQILQKLDEKSTEIRQTIEGEKRKLSKIQVAKRGLLEEKEELHYQIGIKSIPSYQVLSLRRVIPDYYSEGCLWQELSTFVQKNKLEVSESTFSIYHDIEYKETDVDVELCVQVKKSGINEEPFTYRQTEAVPLMAYTMVYGDFYNIAGVFLSFANWLQKNHQYKMLGTSRQIVLRGPWNEENPEQYLIEIQIPIAEISC